MRDALLAKVLEVKNAQQLTWKAIAAEINESSSPILIVAALMGQMTLTEDEAKRAGSLFNLSEAETALLQQPPFRGSLPTLPPTDPLLYRFYELLQVYGTTWKALIEEEFGDGIMSAVDFNMGIEREPSAAGDRVRIVLSGKFLPYKRY